jgi:hypothetical protein
MGDLLLKDPYNEWDAISIKVPIGSFKGKDWQNRVKWMFTCLPIYNY